MGTPIVIAKILTTHQKKLFYFPNLPTGTVLIAGATGTGKTVTLKVLAEFFSNRRSRLSCRRKR